MDDLVLRCSNRNLDDPVSLKHIQDVVIKRNYGFKYEDNFRRMLIQVIGLKHVSRVERRADIIKHQKLISALASLSAARNSAAHTFIKGTTAPLDAPSVTQARFHDVYEGLVELERVMKIVKV
jgi:hypothetical protein